MRKGKQKFYKQVPQVNARDSSITAPVSITKHHGSRYSLPHLRELTKTNREKATTLEIKLEILSLSESDF